MTEEDLNMIINKLPKNPAQEGVYRFEPNVVYSTETGKELTMDLILCRSCEVPGVKAEPKPLIVFVQGSGWTTPNRTYALPMLSAIAQKGYVVATCGHRSTAEGDAPPAYLLDIKCAIRFLRKNAEKYGIDPERVAIWGTSSGGNIAQMVALTGDLPVFETKEHAGYSDAVTAMVSCFGPSDMSMLYQYLTSKGETGLTTLLEMNFGKDQSKWKPMFDFVSPLAYVADDSPLHQGNRKPVPPMLFLHGSGDPTVSFEEMKVMTAALEKAGKEVEAWEIEGAEHEGNFWSPAVQKVIEDFLTRKL